MGLILFALWLALAAYGLCGVVIMIAAGVGSLWRLLPGDPEVADRRARMEHDRAIVAAGKVPGVSG